MPVCLSAQARAVQRATRLEPGDAAAGRHRPEPFPQLTCRRRWMIRLQSATARQPADTGCCRQSRRAPTLALGGTLVLRMSAAAAGWLAVACLSSAPNCNWGRIRPLLQRYWLASLQIDQPGWCATPCRWSPQSANRRLPCRQLPHDSAARPPSPLHANLTRLTLQRAGCTGSTSAHRLRQVH